MDDHGLLLQWSGGKSMASAARLSRELSSQLPFLVHGAGTMMRQARDQSITDRAAAAHLDAFVGVPRAAGCRSGPSPTELTSTIGIRDGRRDNTAGRVSGAPGSGNAGDEAADAQNDFIGGLADAVSQGTEAAWTYTTSYLGENWLDDYHDHLFDDDQCVGEYSFPWSYVDPVCLSPGFGPPLEVLCNPPCIQAFSPPTAADISEMAGLLVVDDGGVEDALDWIALVRQAWTILRQNTDVVGFVACATTRSPQAGDCLINKITSQEPRIILDGSYGWFDRSDPKFSILAGINVISTAVGTLLGGVLGGIVGATLGPSHIRLFVKHDLNVARMAAWREEPSCGAIALAGGFLHELSHLCERDLFDGSLDWAADITPFQRTCPFAVLIAVDGRPAV